MAARQNIRIFFRFRTSLVVVLSCFVPIPANAGLYLDADGRTDAYLLIHEAFGGNSYEVPDCAHSKFGPHITQRYDSELGEPVFAFHLHAKFDNDRCIVFDRQRAEITTFRSKARENDIRTYQWRFKLDEDFVPSTYFNHIFQIRPIDPVPGGNPVFTISTLSGETEELLFYQDTGSGMRLLHRMPLAEFKGRWIDARVRAKFSPSGFIEVQLSSTLGGVVLLEWRQDPINLWPWNEILFTLPKWGNYRSLENTKPLRDEIVLYNDFCVAEKGESCDNLEMLDDIQVTPAAYRLSTEMSIDPFPTDQVVPRDNILRILRQVFLGAESAQRSVRPARSTAGNDADESAEVNEMPVTGCKTTSGRGHSKRAHPGNPFTRSSACTLSWPQLPLE